MGSRVQYLSSIFPVLMVAVVFETSKSWLGHYVFFNFMLYPILGVAFIESPQVMLFLIFGTVPCLWLNSVFTQALKNDDPHWHLQAPLTQSHVLTTNLKNGCLQLTILPYTESITASSYNKNKITPKQKLRAHSSAPNAFMEISLCYCNATITKTLIHTLNNNIRI